jgi:hypothetical protein
MLLFAWVVHDMVESGFDALWQLAWLIFAVIDFPVSLLALLTQKIVPDCYFRSLPYPIGKLRDFIVPAFFYGVLGTLWYFFIPVAVSSIMNKGKRYAVHVTLEQKEGPMRSYAYAVCFISIILSCVFLGMGVWAEMGIHFPELVMQQKDWKKIASLEGFKEAQKCLIENKNLSEDEVVATWQAERANVIESERREATRNLIQMAIGFCIFFPLFLIHWRLAKRL